MKRKLHRCPLCDGWYSETDSEAVQVHSHPKPQSGVRRLQWTLNGFHLPFEQWVHLTEEGRMWNEREKAPGGLT